MLALILFLVFGLVFGYFSTLNTATVSVNFGIYTLTHVPVYLLVLASVGLGLLFASIFYFVKSISYKMASGQKNKELSRKNKEIAELNKEINELEIENAGLKSKSGGEPVDEESI
jgi:uncharacterized integral membrane protein